jgi:hypothetical protein
VPPVGDDFEGLLIMQPLDPEIAVEGALAGAPGPNVRVSWWTRIVLFILHIVAVFGAASLTPEGHFFELGEYTGALLIFGSITLWWFLFSSKTRRGIFLSCVFVVAQAGTVALVGLHFRAEDRMLKPIGDELSAKRREWVAEMEPFRMDALFEMTSGKRELSLTELQELQNRAKNGQIKLGEVESDMVRTRADAERRIATVNSRAAHNFHLGVESTRQLYDEEIKTTRDYLAYSEQLAGFLFNRRGQYAQTSRGPIFKKAEDQQSFDDQLHSIAILQDHLSSLSHRIPPG